MLVELDAINHARGEYTNSARGGLYLRMLIHLLDRRSEFVPLTYKGRDFFRDVKSTRAAFTEERGGRDHNPGKGFHAPLAFRHAAFDAHPVISLRHQVCRVLYSVKCPLQRLRIRERLRPHPG